MVVWVVLSCSYRCQFLKLNFWISPIKSICLDFLIAFHRFLLFKIFGLQSVNDRALVDLLNMTEDFVKQPKIHIINENLTLSIAGLSISLGTLFLDLFYNFFQIFGRQETQLLTEPQLVPIGDVLVLLVDHAIHGLVLFLLLLLDRNLNAQIGEVVLRHLAKRSL